MQSQIPFSHPFLHKAKGWLFLNGNVTNEEDLVRMFKQHIQCPQHFDDQIDRSRKVLLVTAAFEKGMEHHDRHLIYLFEKLHIDAHWSNNVPQNIQNLSVYTMFRYFEEKEPWLYRRYTEKQAQIKAVKRDYYEKIIQYVEKIELLKSNLKRIYPVLSLFDFYYLDKFRENDLFFLYNLNESEATIKLRELNKLDSNEGDKERCSELRKSINHLEYLDDEIFYLCEEIETFFLEKSGIKENSLYQKQRSELISRISDSASIFIFGGRVFVLVNRLRFYQLDKTFKQAINDGTNIFGISAGAICQTNRFSLSFNRAGKAGEIFAADHGLGLINGLRIFPHANDIKYIVDADRDELSFFVLRHREKAVIGLREKSVLLCESYRDPIDNNVYKRYSSVGEHPVMIFGERGEKVELNHYDELFMEGCKFYSGIVQVARRNDIIGLEQNWRNQYRIEMQNKKQVIN